MNKLGKILNIFSTTLIIFFTCGLASEVSANDGKPWWTQEMKSNLPDCKGKDVSKWDNCFGINKTKRHVYQGEWRNGNWHGKGAFTDTCMNYIGEYKDGAKHGEGIYTWEGFVEEGIWENDKFVREKKLSFPRIENSNLLIDDFKKIEPIKKNPNKLKNCPELDLSKHFAYGKEGQTINWNKCWGEINFQIGDKEFSKEGEWKNGDMNGFGILTINGELAYFGEWKNSRKNGKGTMVGDNYKHVGNYSDDLPHGKGTSYSTGCQWSAIFKNGVPDEIELNLPIVYFDSSLERRNIEAEKFRNQWNARKNTTPKTFDDKNKSFDLQVTNTEPDSDGIFTLRIQTNVDTASLKINDQEQGSRADGVYSIKKAARAGKETQFIIVAIDINGNISQKTIGINRPITEAKLIFETLNPTQIKKRPERDAVAIIIGVADYKSLPKADYANDDARVFYDYAIRALGIKPENIRMLVDSDADQAEIYRAFKTWLPSRARSTTDVYVFYSGHGLPSEDGQGLYLMPQRADRDFLDKTAISQQEINAAIQAAKPNSVTIFLDACYSGQSRSGETLLASARPVALKVEKSLFPAGFTVITASQADQISSSSPDLKHGIFSYYLMRGMEGDADTNRDGKITMGEMHSYLTEQVSRQAGMMNRKQIPQLVGDATRVLVGK